jgi:ERCC4-type nuclease
MVKVEIDYREKHLIELFNKNNNDNYDIKTLDIGDILIKNNDGDILYVIERKTVNDLSCSILDGRYNEQKQRLLSNYNTNNIIYVVEGKNGTYHKSVPYKTILSSILSMNLRDNINVIRTYNIEETYNTILLIKSKIEKNKLNCKKYDVVENNIIKPKKKDNMDENMYYIAVLAQIPGCSVTIAKEISNKARSLLELYDIYINNNTEIIKEIKINGKRKIGEKLTNRIFKYLFNEK